MRKICLALKILFSALVVCSLSNYSVKASEVDSKLEKMVANRIVKLRKMSETKAGKLAKNLYEGYKFEMNSVANDLGMQAKKEWAKNLVGNPPKNNKHMRRAMALRQQLISLAGNMAAKELDDALPRISKPMPDIESGTVCDFMPRGYDEGL